MSGILVLALRLLMAAAIYAFLGGALWVIWQDLKQEGQKATAQGVPAIRLQVRARNHILQSRTFTKSEIILGRNPDCDVRLHDETVSVQHARLSFHHNQWWVEDLNSTNGTKLNQAKLTLPTVLTTEDEIECGKTKVIIALDDKVSTSSPTRKL